MNKLSQTAQEYRDYVNYRDSKEWPQWVYDIKTALSYKSEVLAMKVLSGYLPHIINAYNELKEHV